MAADNEAFDIPRLDGIAIAWATTLVVLMAVTWPLWSPFRELPPKLPPLWPTPPPLDAAALGALAGGLVSTVIQGRRWAIGCATAALATLMAGDQLRWQPWAYHALLVGIVLWSADRTTARVALRTVAVAVYVWSALAKLDAEFASTLGSQMVGVVAPAAGPGPRFALALALPIGELAVAALLAVSCWKKPLARWAWGAALTMHAATILLLSPVGLGHGLSVLLWNAGFAWQTVLLFRQAKEHERPRPAWRWPVLALAAVLVGAALPALTPFGRWDAWPGWALYAPRLERATLYVRDEAIDRLPESLRPHVGSPGEANAWRSVDLGNWMLEETHSPIYPANRIVAAAARELARSRPLGGRIAVAAESAAHPVTRQRERQWLDSAEAIDAASRLFKAATP